MLGNTATYRVQATYPTGGNDAVTGGTIAVKNFPVPLAAIGDRPLVSAAALDAGLIVGACPLVTVAGQVSVPFCNPTVSNTSYVTGLVADITLVRATGE